MFNRFFNPHHPLVVLALTLFLCLSTTGISFAQDAYAVPQTAEVTLAWDANDPAPDGYRIYQRTDSTAYDYTQPVWTGAETSGTVYNLEYDTTYYFVVRAYAGSLESADSEEVFYTPTAPAAQTYSITAADDGFGTISPSGTVAVTEGATQTFTLSPNSGYHVADLLVDGVSQGALTSYIFSDVSADHNISATFSENSYTISASAGAGGSISPSGSVSVGYGGSQTFTVTAASGYRVADVLVDGVSRGALASYTFSNVAANHTISATFAVDSYTISASAGAGGRISPSGSVSVGYGGSQTFTVTAASGYHVADMRVDGVSRGALASYTFSNVAANHTISATFAVDNYTISALATDGGSISPAGEIVVESGASQTFTMAPDEGYEIVDLVVNGASVGPQTSYTMANIHASGTIKAVFDLANQAPVADAGPDQTVAEAQQVTLSGLNSIDLDDGIASFQWRQIQGPEVALNDTDQPEASFLAPDVDTSGTSLVFELTVTDYSGVTSVDTSIVNVTWVNMPPTAEAGSAQTVSEGDVVRLDASGSTDPDDGLVGYSWKQVQGPAVSLSNAQSASVSFTAPDISAEGASLTFEVTVTDAGGLQDTDTVLVVVEWVNQAPLADAGADQEVRFDDEVFLDATSSTDTDGTIVAYRWTQTDGIPVELSDATADRPSFVAPDGGETGASLTFELTVTDDGGMLAKDAVKVTIAPVATETENDVIAPSLTIERPSRAWTISWRSSIGMSGKASDDTAVTRVTWENSAGGSGVATGTAAWSVPYIHLSVGFNVITVRAIDAAGNSTSASIFVFRPR